MSTNRRSALASAIGWIIVSLIVIWLFGMLIGWVKFVLRSVAWFLLIGVLLVAYFAVRGVPDD